MSLVDHSDANDRRHCDMPNAANCINGEYIGRDARLRDVTFKDAIDFLRKAQDQW